ncbi:MAG TPA: ABC transporter substrate-binding protein [Rhodospirillaceae bacterium]|nr:ABC transporter substrate-binding protein [Rhodospirillaceae bacterium]
MNRRDFLIAAAATTLFAGQSRAAAPGLEKTEIRLSVGGKPLFYYLPLTIAERLGYFKDEGLTVEISDFGGGAKSLQALMGGSADVTTGSYEHCIQMQAKGQEIVSVIELGRFPGIALGIVKAKAASYKSPKDLKGMKIGVTAPGSSTNFMVNYLLTKNGLQPEDCSFIGIGSGPGAVAAAKRGEIDAVAHLDPVLTQLEIDGDIVIVEDTRTRQGSLNVYGGDCPAAVLYVPASFPAANPNTTRALVHALLRALTWLRAATPDQVADTVPPEWLGGGRDLYIAAFKHSREAISTDGLISADGPGNVLKVLAAFDPAVKGAKIDLSKTFTNTFVEGLR